MEKPHQHIVAHWGTQPITPDIYDAKFVEFNKAVEHFNTTHQAVPHPGLWDDHNFCYECGTDLSEFVSRYKEKRKKFACIKSTAQL